jgi:hypothetical protein
MDFQWSLSYWRLGLQRPPATPCTQRRQSPAVLLIIQAVANCGIQAAWQSYEPALLGCSKRHQQRTLCKRAVVSNQQYLLFVCETTKANQPVEGRDQMPAWLSVGSHVSIIVSFLYTAISLGYALGISLHTLVPAAASGAI